MKAALLFATLAAAACSLPEDSNPAQRCDAEEMCPTGLACYRGFCLGTDEVVVDDAGAVAVADATTNDARVQSVTSTDAALSQDLPSGPTSTTTTTTSTPATATTTTPEAATPAAPAAPAAPATPAAPPVTLPCLSQCTDIAVNNACRDCVRTTFGGDPTKLCGSPAAEFSVALATICQLICTPDKNGSLKCDNSCKGKDCGGE